MAKGLTSVNQAKLLLKDIKIEHSIFALPFALASLWLATGGRPGGRLLLLVVLAMVSARTNAMCINRWADRRIDAKNPRTAGRPTASGRVSPAFVMNAAMVSAVVFILVCSQINPLAMICSPIVLIILAFYSVTKRWTPLSHLFLGLSLGLSPVGAWVAATGWLTAPPLILGAAVVFWVAGFDIIYATQDEAFDRKSGLHSIVVSLGLARALGVSRLLHAACLVLLAWFGFAADLGAPYYISWIIAAGLIAWEHSLVSPRDLSKVQAAFFTANGWVGVLVMVGVMASVSFAAAAGKKDERPSRGVAFSGAQAKAFHEISLRGKDFADKQNFKASAQEFKKALLIWPDSADTYMNLGHVLYYNKTLKLAWDCYAMSLKINPDQSQMKARLKEKKAVLRTFSTTEGAAFLKWEGTPKARGYLVYRKRGPGLPDLKLTGSPLSRPEFVARGMVPAERGVFALTQLVEEKGKIVEKPLGEIPGCAVLLSLYEEILQ